MYIKVGSDESHFNEGLEAAESLRLMSGDFSEDYGHAEISSAPSMQTPSTGLRHPSFNHWDSGLRHRSRGKLSANEQVFGDALIAVRL